MLRLLGISREGEDLHVEDNGTLLRVVGKCADEIIGFEEVARYEDNIVRATADHFAKQLATREDIE